MTRQSGLIIYLLFTFFITNEPGLLNAQQTAADSVKLHLKYTGTGSLNKTNEGTTRLLNNAVLFNLRKAKNALNINAGWIYATTDKTLTNNDFSSSLDFDIYSNNPRFYYWGLSAFDKIYSLDINNRYQGGLGAAYNVFQTSSFRFNVSDGLLYEYSDIYLNDSTREKYSTIRNSLRISYRVSIKDMLVLTGQHFFQPSITRQNDYIIKSSSSLSVHVWRWINFTVALLYNKVSRSDRENLLLSYGVTIENDF